MRIKDRDKVLSTLGGFLKRGKLFAFMISLVHLRSAVANLIRDNPLFMILYLLAIPFVAIGSVVLTIATKWSICAIPLITVLPLQLTGILWIMKMWPFEEKQSGIR